MDVRSIEFHRIDFRRATLNGINQKRKEIDITVFKILADSAGIFLEDSNGYLLRSKDK